jgi:GH15 family glucan-1,4-alpha-glucosidase
MLSVEEMSRGRRNRDGILGEFAAIPYPAIERHGVVGDRRTAALVSSDGVVNWLCLPDYDGAVTLGSLLDCRNGGHWKLGPSEKVFGEQKYVENTVVLKTEWRLPSGRLLLTDAMGNPRDDRSPEDESRRTLVRCLECGKGNVRCSFDLRPARNFDSSAVRIRRESSGFSVRVNELRFHVWTNARLEHRDGRLFSTFDLRAGQKVWAVFELGPSARRWTALRAAQVLKETQAYWKRWLGKVRYTGARRAAICRAALTMHLLTYSPDGSVIAAPTTSVPEHIGGNWNADYRLSWVRDASLCLAILGTLGDWNEAERFLEWLSRLESRHGLPLQVLYGIHGEKETPQRNLEAVSGYRCSQPVRFGNHAYKQYQPGSLGFLADCAWLYLQQGGEWRREYWELIRRVADFVAANWQRPDNGIWELPKCQHYVATRVMSWVALDRAVKIAGRVCANHDTREWRRATKAIHREVMRKGWSTRLKSFRQRYEAENLDSATLLISVMEFLPARHPRVLATIERIEEQLTIDGFVYRFTPGTTSFLPDLPMGEMEGAFLPCTFWLATAYAKAGELEKAEAIIEHVEEISGGTDLLAEGVDARSHTFLGNFPLLFSHAEYVRAVLQIQFMREKHERSSRRMRGR